VEWLDRGEEKNVLPHSSKLFSGEVSEFDQVFSVRGPVTDAQLGLDQIRCRLWEDWFERESLAIALDCL
jgi:hypothetical protein